MADFDEAIRKIIRFEGGYVNDPDDRGGETKFGISKRQYPDLDIKKLTINEAERIYHRDYWQKIKGFALPQKIAEALFDTAVNIGVRRAVKLAQQIAGVKIDGDMGPVSLRAINAFADKDDFMRRFILARIHYYVRIAKKRNAQRKYMYNWVKRSVSFL